MVAEGHYTPSVPPYYLVNSQCVSECPSDMNPIIGSNGCTLIPFLVLHTCSEVC